MSDKVEDLEQAVDERNPAWIKKILSEQHLHWNNGNSQTANDKLSDLLQKELEKAKRNIHTRHMSTTDREIIIDLHNGGGRANLQDSKWIDSLRAARDREAPTEGFDHSPKIGR